MTHALSRGYFVMALECGIGWPSSDRVVSYRNHEITMRPATDEDAPSLVIEVTPEFNQLAARRLLQEFMSGLAWVDGGRLTESFSVFSTGAPMRVGKGPAYGGHTSDALIEYVPDPPDPLARLALAFYREAVSLNAIPYKFLGFVKIVNILRESGADQKAWLSRAAQHVRDHKACERRDEILAQVPQL